MNKKLLITNIQYFSLHDGPGIRTTVFMKGCSLHCPWCSNPENINFKQEIYNRNGENGIYGNEYTIDECYDEIIKDKAYYDEGGGVTFFGGEALLFSKELQPLWTRLKKMGIHIAVETCLNISNDNLRISMDYIDLFYVDLKIMDERQYKSVLGGDYSLFEQNFKLLYLNNKKISIRLPVIGGYLILKHWSTMCFFYFTKTIFETIVAFLSKNTTA